MSTHRQERVSDRIHEAISDLLQNSIRDPRLVNVTITGVEISLDLKAATVFVTSLGDRKTREDALAAMKRAAPFIRRQLASSLQMRFTPELDFVLDESWQRGARIDEILARLQDSKPDEDPNRSPSDGPTVEE
jgi:ribosome-binding factor A